MCARRRRPRRSATTTPPVSPCPAWWALLQPLPHSQGAGGQEGEGSSEGPPATRDWSSGGPGCGSAAPGPRGHSRPPPPVPRPAGWPCDLRPTSASPSLCKMRKPTLAARLLTAVSRSVGRERPSGPAGVPPSAAGSRPPGPALRPPGPALRVTCSQSRVPGSALATDSLPDPGSGFLVCWGVLTDFIAPVVSSLTALV